MPNFFDASNRIKELMSDGPTTPLNYRFELPDMSDFLSTYEWMIDSGNLFHYENYDYVDNGKVVNNLTQCKNLYKQHEDGSWEFLRRERIKTGQNLNFTVYNKALGWFPEMFHHPDLVEAVNGYIKMYGIDVWKILVFKVDIDLGWHMDVDGYYGFRMFLNDGDWKLKFREVKPERKDKLREMTWQGEWMKIHDTVDETTYPEEIVYTKNELPQTFLIDSMNYVHYFENPGPHYGVLVKGVV